jgi:glycosyltransferase involved in cell wall biosynthesis
MANQTRQLGRLLAQEGLTVHVVRTNEPCRPAWVGRVFGLRAALRLADYWPAVHRVAAECDVLHVMANSGLAWFLCALPAIRAGRARGVPVIVNYRGGLAREFLARHARRVVPTLRDVDAVVVPSRFLREVFLEHGIEAQIIPNVVDVATFHPESRSSPVAHAPHIVVTRNLEHIYGIDLVIRAAALLRQTFPGARLSIAGSGPERDRLVRLVRDLGLVDVVRFTGSLTVPDVAALYRTADLVVSPSRADNTPNSLLEALASGVPVVCTDVGGVRYLVEHRRTAWFVPSESPPALARGIATVLGDATLRESLKRDGLTLARSFAWSEVKSQWLGLYRQHARESAMRAVVPA